MKLVTALAFLALAYAPAFAAELVLVKDINQTAGAGTSAPIAWGSEFLGGFCGATSCGAWRLDATASTASYLGGASPMTNLTPAGSKAFFTEYDKIWVTDGTKAGTRLLVNIGFGPHRIVYRAPYAFFDDWGELSVTTGTGSARSLSSGAGAFEDTPPGVVFSGLRGGQMGLWLTDGTDAGTSLLAALPSQSWGFASGRANDVALLAVSAASGPAQLWASNGTPAGTSMIASLDTNDPEFIQVAGIAYYIDGQPSGNRHLMRTDGTAAGTYLLHTWSPADFTPDRLIAAANRLYVAGTRLGIATLWTSDGSAAGTAAVRSFAASPLNAFVARGDSLYFRATAGGTKGALWRTDGTEAGTVTLRQDTTLEPWGFAGDVFLLRDNVLYSYKHQLWLTDENLTSFRRLQVQPGDPSNGSSCSDRTIKLGPSVLFIADDGFHGCELWKSDGTAAGTVLVKDINPGVSDAFRNRDDDLALVASGGFVYFVADDGATGRELWRSDGTDAGTTRVSDANPGAGDAEIDWITALDDSVYFAARGATPARTLWRVQGPGASATNLSAAGPAPRNLVAWQGKLAFVDGSAALRVFDPATGGSTTFAGTAGAVRLAATSSRLYFDRFTAAEGHELWYVDTAGAAQLLKDLKAGPADGVSMLVGSIGEVVFFNGVGGLWRTDGSEAGTFRASNAEAIDRVELLNSKYVFTDGNGLRTAEATSSGNGGFVSGACCRRLPRILGNFLLFQGAGTSGSSGRDLYASDGSYEGTGRLADIGFEETYSLLEGGMLGAEPLPGGTLVHIGIAHTGVEPHLVPDDSTPNPMGGRSVAGVLANTIATSPPFHPVGYTVPFVATATNGQVCTSSDDTCSCDVQGYGSTVTLRPGLTFCVQHRASAANSATTTTSIQVPGYTSTFSSFTRQLNPPTFGIDPPALAVRDTGGGVLRVWRGGISNFATQISWTTADDTAIAGRDYGTIGSPAKPSGTLTWPANDFTPREIHIGTDVPLILDGSVDPERRFKVLLPTGLVTDPGEAIVTIADSTSQVDVAPATLRVVEGAVGSAQLVVTRTGDRSGPAQVSWVTQDGAAKAGVHFGLPGSSAPIAGTITFAPGVSTRMITVGATGADVPIIADPTPSPDKAFAITLASPQGVTLGASTTTVTIGNAESGVVMQASRVDVAEPADTVQVGVLRVGDLSQPATVTYSTVNGSATAPAHYRSASGTLSWAAGDGGSRSIPVTVVNDTAINAARTFSVKLSGPEVAAQFSTTEVRIVDDDNTVQFASAAPLVAAEGGAPLRIAVTRTGSSLEPVTVRWDIASLGSTPLGEDFTGPLGGAITWPADDLAPRFIELAAVNDTRPESPKTFSVALSAPQNAKLGAPGTVNITLNDDDAGLAFELASQEVPETRPTVTLRVVRGGPAGQPVTVKWKTVNGTAVAGRDFGVRAKPEGVTGTLTWSATDLAPKSLSIPILSDTESEGLETFTVALFGATGAPLLEPSIATVKIVDNQPGPYYAVRFLYEKDWISEATLVDAQFTLRRERLPGAPDGASTVQYTTVPGTATAGSDFVARSGSVTWAAGDYGDKVVGVRIVTSNNIPEPVEAFQLQLTSASPGTRIDTPEATMYILDDDEQFPPFGGWPDGWIIADGAHKGWRVSNDPGAYEGAFTVRSEQIEDGQIAAIQVSRIFAAGNITFRVRVSSELTFDRLRFFVDDVEKGAWSGTSNTGWQVASIPITAGTHTIRWSYEKDASASVGQDAAWIDAVVLP